MTALLRLIIGVWAAATLPVAACAGTVTVFAAASLKGALDDIADEYTTATGTRVVLSYAGSSALARQIQNGAPAELFISANPGWMDLLEEDGLLVTGTRMDLVTNTLVLIAPADAEAQAIPNADGLTEMLGDLPKGDFVAMALVDAVPAGIYGKAALQKLGVWEDIAGQVAQTDNVRAALRLVALGEAPLGIVYATDAQDDPNVEVVFAFPPDSHPPIRYPVAAMVDGSPDAANPFLTHLQSAAARMIFQRYGFGIVSGNENQ